MELNISTGHVSMCLAGILLVILALLLVWRFVCVPRQLQDEPVYVPSKIFPVLGHTMGMMLGSNRYLEKIALDTPHPIFKIQVLSRELYIVNCPETASAIYRNSLQLSFSVMIISQMRRLLNLSSGVVLRTNPSGDPTMPELRALARSSHTKLRPNKDPAMFVAGHDHLRGVLDGIPPAGNLVDLLPWLHRVMSGAGAAALYGRDNPVAWDSNFTQTINDIDSDSFFLQNFGRHFMAHKGGQAIDRVSALFQEYYARNLVKNACGMVSDRYAFFRQFWDPNTIARFEILVIGTLVTNNHLLTFWMIVFIFGDTELLSDLRAELCPPHPPSMGVLNINTAALIERCPRLNSTWLETLRVTNSSISSRSVLADTMLPSGHLLKKGAQILISAGAIHRSTSIWGPDAASFNPRRFLDGDALSGPRRKALLPFGGGSAYCPGRHLVRDQVLGLVVALVVSFEVVEVGKKGLEVPRVGSSSSVEVIRPPVRGLRVHIRRREGYEGIKVEMEVPTPNASAYRA